MSTPATGPTGNNPPASVRKRMTPREIFSAWFNILGFIVWPISFFYGLFDGLWSIRHLTFPFTMRVGRRYFWVVILTEAINGIFIFAIIQAAAEDLPARVTFMLNGIVGAAFAISWAAVIAGRLRDLNWSGWWAVALCGIPATAAGALLYGKSPETASDLCFDLVWVFAPLALVALGSLRGTRGANAYGPEIPWGRPTRGVDAK